MSEVRWNNSLHLNSHLNWAKMAAVWCSKYHINTDSIPIYPAPIKCKERQFFLTSRTRQRTQMFGIMRQCLCWWIYCRSTQIHKAKANPNKTKKDLQSERTVLGTTVTVPIILKRKGKKRFSCFQTGFSHTKVTNQTEPLQTLSWLQKYFFVFL